MNQCGGNGETRSTKDAVPQGVSVRLRSLIPIEEAMIIREIVFENRNEIEKTFWGTRIDDLLDRATYPVTFQDTVVRDGVVVVGTILPHSPHPEDGKI